MVDTKVQDSPLAITQNVQKLTISSSEPLLTEDKHRYLLFPVVYQNVYDMYTKAKRLFWFPDEIDFAKDKRDFQDFSAKEQTFILHVLAFFAVSDGIVIENLVENFCGEVQMAEARAFYAIQAAIETIHSEVYSKLLNEYCRSEDEKKRLFNGFETIPGIKAKCKFAEKWMSPSKPFGERLVAFAVVEGLLFSSSFASIFWIKEQHPGKCSGLTTSNEFISRDEGLHTDFAVLLFKELLVNKPTKAVVRSILIDGVDVETAFVKEAISEDLEHLKQTDMIAYVRFVANRLCKTLINEALFDDCSKICPLKFMEKLSLEGKSNFFEKRVTEYALPTAEENIFDLDDSDDF